MRARTGNGTHVRPPTAPSRAKRPTWPGWKVLRRATLVAGLAVTVGSLGAGATGGIAWLMSRADEGEVREQIQELRQEQQTEHRELREGLAEVSAQLTIIIPAALARNATADARASEED